MTAPTDVVFKTGFEQSVGTSRVHGRDGGQVDDEVDVVILPCFAECTSHQRCGVPIDRTVTVHTVVSGWGRLNATVMTGVPEEHREVRGDQSVSIMVQLLSRGCGGDENGTQPQQHHDTG